MKFGRQHISTESPKSADHSTYPTQLRYMAKPFFCFSIMSQHLMKLSEQEQLVQHRLGRCGVLGTEDKWSKYWETRIFSKSPKAPNFSSHPPPTATVHDAYYCFTITSEYIQNIFQDSQRLCGTYNKREVVMTRVNGSIFSETRILSKSPKAPNFSTQPSPTTTVHDAYYCFTITTEYVQSIFQDS